MGGTGGDGGWGGGGVICPPGGCGFPERDYPDWQAGSALTSPPAKLPLFSGLTETKAGYRLNYEITSVLQQDDTVSELDFGEHLAHVVYLNLRHVGSSQFLDCDDLRYVEQQTSFFIPQGSSKKYLGSGGTSFCERPANGLYELRYSLDPGDLWDESVGEGNNTDRLRGKLLIR
jgi:hypothetical protein